MALIDVVMPQMGESIAEGTISKWHKKVGERIGKDETLLEISTDKVDSEIPSPAAGVIAELLFQETTTVAVHTVIARINTDVNAAVAPVPAAPSPAVSAPAHAAAPAAPVPVTGGAVVDVIMPQMGESIAEGTITKWHKKTGERIGKDETLLEISTDKVDSEIPSPASGVITELLFPEQTTVAVHTVIARIATGATASAAPAVPATPAPAPSAVPAVAPAAPVQHAAPAPASAFRSDRFYSPLVLNIARTEGIAMQELESIPGTGANGRVSKKDILSYVEQRRSGRVAPAAP
ncbi:MAG: 2-oxoglutarate dehydrogenase, E2 component, dihydrolipoamide succinyltransferase, partial [Bacteroidetes bacterium]